MILGVLAVLWLAFLTPMAWRRLSRRGFTSPLAWFSDYLMRRASNSHGSYRSDAFERPEGSVPGVVIGFSAAAHRLHEARYGTSASPTQSPLTPPAVPVSVSLSPSPVTAARRRRVGALLVGATALFLLLGLIPGASICWAVSLITLSMTLAYVALLVHFHRVAVERAQKVIALETRRYVATALDARRNVVTPSAVAGVSSGYGRPQVQTTS